MDEALAIELTRIGYETWREELEIPKPEWDDLDSHDRAAWVAATKAIVQEAQTAA